MTETAIISTKDLNLYYGDHHALQDINISFTRIRTDR